MYLEIETNVMNLNVIRYFLITLYLVNLKTTRSSKFIILYFFLNINSSNAVKKHIHLFCKGCAHYSYHFFIINKRFVGIRLEKVLI